MSPLMGVISDISGEIWMIIYSGNYPEWTGPPDRAHWSPRQARLGDVPGVDPDRLLGRTLRRDAALIGGTLWLCDHTGGLI